MKGNIINSYADLSIGAYLNVCKAVREAEGRSDLERQVSILAAMYGVSEDEVLDLPLAEYTEKAAGSVFLETPYINPKRVADRYLLGDFVLVPTLDITKMTAGQYIDFQTFAEKGEETLVEQLSAFLIPEGCTYNTGYDVIKVQDAIREHLSVADCLALTAFFLRKWAESMQHTLTSLRREARRTKDKEMKETILRKIQEVETSLKGGDGSQTSTGSAKR